MFVSTRNDQRRLLIKFSLTCLNVCSKLSPHEEKIHRRDLIGGTRVYEVGSWVTRNSFGSPALLLDLLSIFGFLCSFCRELAALSKTGKTTLFGLVECTYEFNTPREIPPNYIPSPGTDKLTFCCRFLHFLGENDG